MIHELKTWPIHFEAIREGARMFEMRRNDRVFRRGDELLLREYDPGDELHKGYYTGREIRRHVSYVMASHHASDEQTVRVVTECRRLPSDTMRDQDTMEPPLTSEDLTQVHLVLGQLLERYASGMRPPDRRRAAACLLALDPEADVTEIVSDQ